MTVIQFPHARAKPRSDLPLAVFAHALPELSEADSVFDAEWLSNCIVNTTIGLFAARRLGLPVAHLLLTPEDNTGKRSNAGLPGLKALPTEAVFSYTYPSVFGSPLFDEFLDEGEYRKLALFGFAANDVGLVSAIHGAQRDLDVIFIRECSPLFSIDDCSLEMSDSAIFGTISYFAPVMSLPDFIEAFADRTGMISEYMPPAESLIDQQSLQSAIASVCSHTATQNPD